MGIQGFRAAIEAADVEAIKASLAADVTLHSPATRRPFEGPDLVGGLLGAARGLLEDFRYTEVVESGGTAALVFEARIGALEARGLDLVHLDAAGKVGRVEVMVRPIQATSAFVEGMGVRASALLAERKLKA
jgi:hypothetical protein